MSQATKQLEAVSDHLKGAGEARAGIGLMSLLLGGAVP